jgi:hypothetical protein
LDGEDDFADLERTFVKEERSVWIRHKCFGSELMSLLVLSFNSMAIDSMDEGLEK